MGAHVSISPPLNMQSVRIKQLLADKVAVRELFRSVVLYSRPHIRKDRNGMNDQIALEELMLYFTKDVSKFLTANFVCNSLVIIAAFENCLKRKRTHRSKISEKQFLTFLESMFLFSHLWEMYLISDDHIQDEIIFIGEFKRAKDKLGKVKGFTFKQEVSDEEWEKSFRDIDRSSDEEITFSEVCRFVTKKVITPKKYSEVAISQTADVKHTMSNRRSMRVFSTRREPTKKVIELTKQLSFKVDGDMYAVSISSPTNISRQSNFNRQGSSSNMENLKNVIDTMGDDEPLQANDLYQDEGNDMSATGRLSLFEIIKRKKAQLLAQRTSPDDTDSVSHLQPIPAMDFYTCVNAAKMASDIQNTRRRLTLLRGKEFGSHDIPDHTVPTEIQKRAARNKEMHARTILLNDMNPASEIVKQRLPTSDTFAAKFPDNSKKNPRPCPPDYNVNLHDDGDLNFRFVTENFDGLENTSLEHSALDSNYLHIDPSNISHYGTKDRSNSLTIRVQSDLGGSIHTSSMQHLSFDRDVSRKPPHIVTDASIALSSVNHDALNDDMSFLDGREDSIVDSPVQQILVQEQLFLQEQQEEEQRKRELDAQIVPAAKPPHLHTYDTSIIDAASQNSHTDIGDIVSPPVSPPKYHIENIDDDSPQNRSLSPQPRTSPFEPLNAYAAEEEKRLKERVEYNCAKLSLSDSASNSRAKELQSHLSNRNTTEIHNTKKMFTKNLYPNVRARPGSAPARASNVTLNLAPDGPERELEDKYYPPAKQLGYYVKRAKSASSHRKKADYGAPRALYTVPSHLKGGPSIPRYPPSYHAWMLDESDEEFTRRYATTGGIPERTPMNLKKSRAIAMVKRKKLGATR